MQRIFLIINILLFPLLCSAQNYDTWFSPSTLRIDYFRSGNATEHSLTLDKLLLEGEWPGTRTKLVDPFHYGEYRTEVVDKESDSLIYAQGYSSLFMEWQTTAEAREVQRSFRESFRIPFPLQTVKVRFMHREKGDEWLKDWELVINPADPNIIREARRPFLTHDIYIAGPNDACMDLAILAEGYTSQEMEKFIRDAERFAGYLFENTPYDEFRDRINIRAVLSISPESGTDLPHQGIWKNTIMNSRFFTFGSDRYLTTDDYHSLMDVASNVAWDQVLVLVNSESYGGGGIYNHYLVCTSDHSLSDFVFIHELGHSLAGLGDEYYSSSTAYEDFYDVNIEPWEPNLTTLVDFRSKWQDMLIQGTPIPTPLGPKYKDVVGVFEGGGYQEKGIYRPFPDCTMKSALRNSFCPVCQRSIRQMLEQCSEKR